MIRKLFNDEVLRAEANREVTRTKRLTARPVRKTTFKPKKTRDFMHFHIYVFFYFKQQSKTLWMYVRYDSSSLITPEILVCFHGNENVLWLYSRMLWKHRPKVGLSESLHDVGFSQEGHSAPVGICLGVAAELFRDHNGAWHADVFCCFVHIDHHVHSDSASPRSNPDQTLFAAFTNDQIKPVRKT